MNAPKASPTKEESVLIEPIRDEIEWRNGVRHPIYYVRTLIAELDKEDVDHEINIEQRAIFIKTVVDELSLPIRVRIGDVRNLTRSWDWGKSDWKVHLPSDPK